MIWTATTIAEMYALLDEGLSWSAVGARMGCSKNTIAGKLRRLGQRPRPASEPPVHLPSPPPMPSVRTCQWIEGDDPRAWVFCGEPVWRGVYCRACFARCYQRLPVAA